MKFKNIYVFVIILTGVSAAFGQATDPTLDPFGGAGNPDYEELVIEPFPVELKVVHSIPVGSGPSELGYLYEDVQGGTTTGPHDLLITGNYIYLSDELNGRQVALSRDYKEFKSLGSFFGADYYSYLDGSDEYLITSGHVYSLSEGRSLIDRDVFAYDNIHPEYDLNPYYFSLVDNRFLILDNRGKKGLVLLDLLIDNSSFDKVMYDAEAEKYFSENSGSIEVVDGRYILCDGMLVTKSALTFMRYFKEHNSQINYCDDEMGYYIDRFCGTDDEGNYYWSAYDNQILIFEINGNFVQALQIDSGLASGFITHSFSVDGEGNIYSLAIDDEGENYKLLRIEKDW